MFFFLAVSMDILGLFFKLIPMMEKYTMIPVQNASFLREMVEEQPEAVRGL